MTKDTAACPSHVNDSYHCVLPPFLLNLLTTKVIPIVGLASAGPSKGTACFCIGTSTARFLGSPAEVLTSHKYYSSEVGHVESDGTAERTYFTIFDTTT